MDAATPKEAGGQVQLHVNTDIVEIDLRTLILSFRKKLANGEGLSPLEFRQIKPIFYATVFNYEEPLTRVIRIFLRKNLYIYINTEETKLHIERATTKLLDSLYAELKGKKIDENLVLYILKNGTELSLFRKLLSVVVTNVKNERFFFVPFQDDHFALQAPDRELESSSFIPLFSQEQIDVLFIFEDSFCERKSKTRFVLNHASEIKMTLVDVLANCSAKQKMVIELMKLKEKKPISVLKRDHFEEIVNIAKIFAGDRHKNKTRGRVTTILKKEKHFTQEDLAFLLNISQKTLSRIVKSIREMFESLLNQYVTP